MDVKWMVLVLIVVSGRIVTGFTDTVAILFDSSALDGGFQSALLEATLLALRDSDIESRTQPLLFDFKDTDPSTCVDQILRNGTRALISLLPSQQTKSISELLGNGKLKDIRYLYTPRTLSWDTTKLTRFLQVRSLQMHLDARITALLHRIKKVGTQVLLPVLDDESQLPLLWKYQMLGSRLIPGVRFRPPVFRSKVTNYFPLSQSQSQSVLLLSCKSMSSLQVLENHFFHWFSHELPFELEENPKMLGLYSVQFVGSGNWDNVKRRRILKKLNQFTGPSPTILSLVLAYDIASLALATIESFSESSIRSLSTNQGLSGDIHFNSKGLRSEGVFFGLTALPKSQNLSATFLQPSDWILEDLLHLQMGLNGIEVTIGEYQIATSSVLSKEELIQAGNKVGGRKQCSKMEMEVLARDPFNQMEYKFGFVSHSLPSHLLIANQYGYGLKFHCLRQNSVVGTVEIGCTPYANSIGERVHCYKSKIRRKRTTYSESLYNYLDQGHYRPITNYGSPREEINPIIYYQSPPQDSYYNGYNEYLYDSSTPATLSTRLDVPINEPLVTVAPHAAAAGAKLPELRQVLKAAKPFVGSCVGSTAGCAVCVLVLGRLPLGVVPAACTGPCFIGTFGTCGSLLGRVFSETTVICTELFRQGFLDMETFIADAEFGRKMAQESPETLLGYYFLASPLVNRMKESEDLTKAVAFFALPWAQYMKYLVGHSQEFSWSGYAIHTIGSLVCSLTGFILATVESPRTFHSVGFSVAGMVIGMIFAMRKLVASNT